MTVETPETSSDAAGLAASEEEATLKEPEGSKSKKAGDGSTLLGFGVLIAVPALAVGVVASIFGGCGSSGPDPEALQAAIRDAREDWNATLFSPPGLPEAALEAAVRDTLGSKVTAVTVRPSAYEDGRWLVSAKFSGTDSFTKSMIRSGMERDMLEAYESIFTSGVPIHFARMTATFTMIDGLGNESVTDVYATQINFDVGEQVNWENVVLLDPARLWSVNRMHRAFAE